MKIQHFNNLKEKYVLSIPPLVYLIMLFLVPTIFMLIIAFGVPGEYGGTLPVFQDLKPGGIKFNLSLDSFKFVLTSKLIWQIFWRSIGFSILTTFLCLLLGYPLAMLIVKSRKKYRDIMLLLVIIPFWSCFLIRVYAWMIILGPNSGVNYVVNYILEILGYQPLNLLYSSIAVIICLVYINLPFMILPLYANLEKHDESLIEASRDLGATKFQTFLRVTVPLSMPGILSGSALVFIPSIGMFVVPELIGNNCSLMIGNLIKQQFLQTMNWPLGSATSIVTAISVLGISLLVGVCITRIRAIGYASKTSS